MLEDMKLGVMGNALKEMVSRVFRWTLPLEMHLLDIMAFLVH